MSFFRSIEFRLDVSTKKGIKLPSHWFRKKLRLALLAFFGITLWTVQMLNGKISCTAGCRVVDKFHSVI